MTPAITDAERLCRLLCRPTLPPLCSHTNRDGGRPDARIQAAGVPRITVHGARRACGSLLVDLDVHPRVAMQILWHANFNITMEIYNQVFP